MFSNKVYDLLKWISLVFLPALITFVGVVLNTLDIPNTEVILTISIAFNTFLGTILGISNINYNKATDLIEETSNQEGDDDDEKQFN